MRATSLYGGRRSNLAMLILLSLALLVSQNARGAPSSIDWEALPVYRVGTTQGSFLVNLQIQLARDETEIHFRAQFDYPVAPNDPELIYFAVEFDLSGRGRPMSAGNEMIIVSRKDPSGGVTSHYSFFVEQTERNPLPAPTNVVTLDTLQIVGSGYSVEFHRPLQTSDATHHFQFGPNSSVFVAFAVGEWGIGRAHSYTAMSYIISVTETEVLLTRPTPSFFSLALTKEAANLLGQSVLIATFVLIGVHIFRRRIWSLGAYHPWLKEFTTVEVERHSPVARVTHLLHLGLLLIFVATGYSMLRGQPIFGGWTLGVHMVAAFMVIVNIPLHFLALRMAGEWRSLVRVTADDIRVAITLALNFFGLSKKYPEHVTYETTDQEYYKGRKYCAFQKFLLWGDTLFFTVMALTGFALYYAGGLEWLQAAFGGRESTLAFHDLFFYLLSSTVLGHFYFSLVPANWPRLRSIVLGGARIPIHRPHTSEHSGEEAGTQTEDLT